MRKNLQIGELGNLLEQPLNAVLATHLSNGEVLQTPVWYEWQSEGFNITIGANDIKHRNLERDPRTSVIVFENGGLNRGIEVRGNAHLSYDNANNINRRIALRYVGAEGIDQFLKKLNGIALVHIRLEPEKIRIWDFADEVQSQSF